MKVTIVVDNCVPISTPSPFLAEHGSSILLEFGGTKILVDTGQSNAVIHNLSLLGIHPGELDAIFLSHGHYDHAGGLFHILKCRRKPIPVYAHPHIFKQRVSLVGGRYHIGIPHLREELTSLGAVWQFDEKTSEVFRNLWYSGEVPRITDYEFGDTRLVTDNEGCDCQDDIEDDTSLFYKSANGLVVIGGCSHSGLVNTIQYGLQVTGENKLLGWIGGTHLGPVSVDQQNKSLGYLEQLSPEFIAANHCTGFPMMSELHQRFGKRFIPAFVSVSINC